MKKPKPAKTLAMTTQVVRELSQSKLAAVVGGVRVNNLATGEAPGG